MFDAAVAAALPARIVPRHLPAPPKGRTIVLGAGKASAAMAKAVEEHWPGPLEGLVVTRYGHAVPCERIEIVEAAHPVPDAAGQAAAARILALARGAGPDDLVLCLISGGGSALLALPAQGLTLADKQAVNQALLASGADIGQMNAVRKHLSAIKGGRLAAAAHPAKVVSLLISDVPGDDPAAIASGPTVADPTTFADARAVLERYRHRAAGSGPPAIWSEAREETPKPGDPRLAEVENIMIATPQRSLEAAAAVAQAAGITPLLLGDALEGEAREVGKVMAGIARSVAVHGHPLPRPACCSPAARPRSPCGARAAAGAMSSSCWPWRWRWRDCRASGRSPATRTGSTAPRTAPARSSRRTRLARASALGHRAAGAALADNDGHGFFQALGDRSSPAPR